LPSTAIRCTNICFLTSQIGAPRSTPRRRSHPLSLATSTDTNGWDPDRLALTTAEVRGAVIGRERELELILAAVAAGRDLILEGPPGTTKTTLLKAITAAWGIPLIFVEGNAELTPGRLIGHHDPARVLAEGY